MGKTWNLAKKALAAAALSAALCSLPAMADTAQGDHNLGICRVMPAATFEGRKASAFINTMNALTDAGIIERASFYQGYDLDIYEDVDIAYGAFSTGQIEVHKYAPGNVEIWNASVPDSVTRSLESEGKDYFSNIIVNFNAANNPILMLGATSGGSFTFRGQTYRGEVNATCTNGESITLQAAADADNEFVGWYEGIETYPDYFVTKNTGTLISSDASITFTISEPVFLQAVFKTTSKPAENPTIPAEADTPKETEAPKDTTGTQTATTTATTTRQAVDTSQDAAQDGVKITINKKPVGVKAKAKKNKVTVTWKKIKKTNKTKKLLNMIKKIEVQYDTNKDFLKPVSKMVGKKKTKAVLKLKKKTTYYVRVRYVGSDGVSAWSKVKRVKTK